MMKITSLELKNFGNFGDYTFDRFSTNGFTAITGNVGSGKTIIIEAVAFVLGASQESLGISDLSSLIKHDVIWTCNASVKLTLLVGNNREVILEKIITKKGFECFFDQKRVQEKTYMMKLHELKICDQYFLPIFNETINCLSNTADEYANFFEKIVGTNEEGRECDDKRVKLENETRILDEHKKHKSVIDMERWKTTELYLARLFFYDDKIRLKENEIVEKKKNPKKLKAAVAALKKEKYQLYAERHYFMHQCQINKIPFPTGSQVVSVLSSDDLRFVSDPVSADLLEEKKNFTSEEVEKGMQVAFNHDDFKRKFPKTPSVEVANSYCIMTYNELKLVKNDLPEDFKTMPLIRKEALCNKIIDEKEIEVDALEEGIRDLIVQRRNSFLDFLDAVAAQLDQEFKDLWGNDEKRRASLKIADRENPWDGVTIKVHDGNLKLSFRSLNMEAQKMANIALLFAMAKVKGSSFVFIDGVTKHIQHWGFDRLISYLKKKSETFQVVTTSVTSTFPRHLLQAGVAAQNI